MQTTFFDTGSLMLSGDIVNVASVPQRSPFRYPGGKTWLIPRVRRWLKSRPSRPAAFIEPFAGGAIASLTAVAEHLAEVVTMVERDEEVAAVWRVILQEEDGGVWLADQIVNFELTPANAQAVLSMPSPDLRMKAFRTILKNRVNHGGIMAPGAGVIKHGENGNGIKSRWYPETLRKRILAIAQHRDRLRFVEGNGLHLLAEHAHHADAVFFIDPPYTAAGKGKRAGTRLYTHNELDHEELFRIASTLRGDFLMTYDNADSVRDLAKQFGFATRVVAMKNTHHAEMSELLVGRDLGWVQ